MRNLVNALLLLVTAAGGVLFYRHRAVVAPLRAEYARLAAKYADFESDDPSLHSFARVETHDPYTFAWRGYHPGGPRQVRFGFVENDPSRQPENSLPAGAYHFRLNFHIAGDHVTASLLDSLKPNSSWTRSEGQGHRRYGKFRHEVTSFLQENWHRLDFAMSPAGNAVQTDANAVTVFLQIRIPEELRDELEHKTDPLTAAELVLKPLFYLAAGPQAAFDRPTAAVAEPPSNRLTP